MKRLGFGGVVASLIVVITAAPAMACGGLIGPRGSVNLLRTTTLAAYHGGIEHYITSFQFIGGGGAFGSLVPLPGIPSKVERGGDWTLQRLVRETQRQTDSALSAGGVQAQSARSAQVIFETRIDALDITVLKGGGDEVGVWAKDNGFSLPPDAPEVLDFYASRSPIFMAARFDADAAAAQGQQTGDGTPIHLSIPTDTPWVPLRILGLGKQANEVVQADVYLLTDTEPRLLPGARRGLIVDRSERASDSLIQDLRTDKGMEWIPTAGMWLSYLIVDSEASDLTYDLAVSVDGSAPSRIDAGLSRVQAVVSDSRMPVWTAAIVLMLVIVGLARLTFRPAPAA